MYMSIYTHAYVDIHTCICRYTHMHMSTYSTSVLPQVILCRIRAYKDDGLVDMTPGFSPKAPIKVNILLNSEFTQEEFGTESV